MPTRLALTGGLAAALLVLLTAGAGASSGANVLRVSHCAQGPNAEVVQAVDGTYVYEAWIGCGGIGFARSTDGGQTFGPSLTVLGSDPSGGLYSWDPALAVAPDGTVYVAYMVGPARLSSSDAMTPAVAVSNDHGASFTGVSTLPIPPSDHTNWGDRPWIAVGPDGAVYVTWDYGPRRDQVKLICAQHGSCYFGHGDFNAVVQKSVDGAKTWTDLAPISSGYPLGGAYSAPIVAEPGGAIDALYIAQSTDPTTRALSPGHEYFTRSTDGGSTWSQPVVVGKQAGTTSVREWWIDGALALDSAGTLYAVWDTQAGKHDRGWLAWSTDHGATWSSPRRVASSPAEHLMEVAADGLGDVYVGWQTVVPGKGKGYATVLRRYSVGHGWTGPARRVSPAFGKTRVWPGDTFGLSTSGSTALVSWGSAVGKRRSSQIWFSTASLPAVP